MCKLEHLFWSFQEPKMRPSCEIVADSPALGARHWVSTGTSSGLPGSSRGPIRGASCGETYWERTPGRSSKLPGLQTDPEIVTRLLLGGQDAVESALEKLAEKHRQEIEKERRDGGDRRWLLTFCAFWSWFRSLYFCICNCNWNWNWNFCCWLRKEELDRLPVTV